MGKYDTDEIGEPGKPPRRFPWRLWLFALLMTAAAGAGGYFTWYFREQAQEANTKHAVLETSVTGKEAAVRDGEQKACTAKLDEANTKSSAALAAQVQKGKDCESERENIAKKLNVSSQELAVLTAQRAETEKRIKAVEDIQKQFAKMIDTGQLKVAARRGSLVISLPAEVLFPSGVADLSEQGKLKVIEIGVLLKNKDFAERRFMVLGHTDDQPLSNSVFKDNWELSTERALNVTRVLKQTGMNPKNLIAAGAGEHDPVTSPRDRAKNRRIEIILLPAINELPPLPASVEKTEPKGA